MKKSEFQWGKVPTRPHETTPNSLVKQAGSVLAVCFWAFAICVALFSIAGVLSIWAGPMSTVRIYFFAGFISYLIITYLLLWQAGPNTYYNLLVVEIGVLVLLLAGFAINFFSFMDHGSLALHTILGWPAIASAIILFIAIFFSTIHSPAMTEKITESRVMAIK